MPPHFSMPPNPCICRGSVAKILRLSLADLRRNGFALYQEAQYVNWCGHAEPFVPMLVAEDVAELVPILGRRRDTISQ